MEDEIDAIELDTRVENVVELDSVVAVELEPEDRGDDVTLSKVVVLVDCVVLLELVEAEDTVPLEPDATVGIDVVCEDCDTLGGAVGSDVEEMVAIDDSEETARLEDCGVDENDVFGVVDSDEGMTEGTCGCVRDCVVLGELRRDCEVNEVIVADTVVGMGDAEESEGKAVEKVSDVCHGAEET